MYMQAIFLITGHNFVIDTVTVYMCMYYVLGMITLQKGGPLMIFIVQINACQCFDGVSIH